METTLTAPGMRLAFGRPVSQCHWGVESGGFVGELAVPCLAGTDEESIMESVEGASVEKCGSFTLIRDPGGKTIGGFAVRPCPGPAEPVAHGLYTELLNAIAGLRLYRIWNFVPRINAEVSGREQYQSFNIGRCRAFRERFGEEAMVSQLPAASAVGTEEPSLGIAFLAGAAPVSYFENPRQLPAYRYPEQYGPCSPSFARGAVVTAADGRRTGYLSGTSSICGHATVGAGSLGGQFDTTVENIRVILERMGFDGALDADSPCESTFRVYLRHANDLNVVRDRFEEIVGPRGIERTMFLQAAICRSPLLLEIEGIFAE